MQAVILAAGKSTRTYPLTVTRPKQLLTVLNKTILEHNLDALAGLVDEAIIVVGYKKEMIIERFGNKYKGIRLEYVTQKEQLGTGHALTLVKHLVKDRFIMLYGDDLYSGKDLKKCLTHKYCVLAREVKDPQRFGVLKLKGGRVTGIVEKPKTFVSTLANCGGFVLDKKIFDVKLEKTERGEYEATDFINSLAGKEKIDYERVEDYWIPIGYPWSLLEANELLMATVKEKNLGRIEKGATIKGPVQIGSGTIVKSGSYIEGPVIIGEDCEIGPNCYLRKGTTVGHRCKIGQATEVKNTIIMDDSKVPHLSYIGDSVIGEHVNLGAGTITANLRHDSGSVKSMVREQLVDTGRRKLGAIIGDHVHTGINTSIFPGRKIWPNKTTQPGEIVTKDVM